MDRKDFLKRTCLAGVCLCGFGKISSLANNQVPSAETTNTQINQDWLSNLLSNLNQDLDEDVLKKIVKKASKVHYEHLNMEELLSDYRGNIEKFNEFLEKTWDWRVDYDKTKGVLIVDENKDVCVCPVLEHKEGVDSSALCYCSEGFAERMYSAVAGVPVTAKVISAVRKGDKTCKYRIEIS